LAMLYQELHHLTVEELVQKGAGYQGGKICAKGHVGLAVPGATVSPRALTATMRLALAMLK
ncbi:Snakin-2, partial [Sesamum angolense]